MRNRIKKIEEFLDAEREKKRKRFPEQLANWKILASHHATAVAAIVLAGQPRIDEPLNEAWVRALEHYKIDCDAKALLERILHYGAMDDFKGALLESQIAAAQQLRPKIMGSENESARFTDIFRTAPVWLLQFTGMAWDARLLQFQLPDLSQTFFWGSVGYEEAQGWPFLPPGIMMAGTPIPRHDGRRMWIMSFCQMTVPIPDENMLSQAMKDNYSRCDRCAHSLLEGLALLRDLEKNPERELSRYEKRLVRRLERMSGASG